MPPRDHFFCLYQRINRKLLNTKYDYEKNQVNDAFRATIFNDCIRFDGGY